MEPIADIARRTLRATPEFKVLQLPKQSVSGQAINASASALAEANAIVRQALAGNNAPTVVMSVITPLLEKNAAE